MTMGSSDGSRSPSRKAATPETFAIKITTNDLLDSHQQLRHEASGLRLQLASKEEVLERLLDMLDKLAAEVADKKNTNAAQANQLLELRTQLELSQRREADLKEKLAKHGEHLATPFSNAAAEEVVVGRPPRHARQEIKTEQRLAEDNQQPTPPPASSSKNASNLPKNQSSKHRKTASDITPSNNNIKSTQQPPAGERPSSGRNKVNLGIFGSTDMDTPPPLPGASKLPMLAPYCKITAAARASERPLSARQQQQQPEDGGQVASTS